MHLKKLSAKLQPLYSGLQVFNSSDAEDKIFWENQVMWYRFLPTLPYLSQFYLHIGTHTGENPYRTHTSFIDIFTAQRADIA